MTISALTPWFWLALALAFVWGTGWWLLTRAASAVNPVPGRGPEPPAPEWEFSEYWDGEPAPRASV